MNPTKAMPASRESVDVRFTGTDRTCSPPSPLLVNFSLTTSGTLDCNAERDCVRGLTSDSAVATAPASVLGLRGVGCRVYGFRV